jgi:hypothetical protein
MDDLNAARGIFVGVILCVVIWVIFYLLVR